MIMNKYLRNLNRIEFVITWACTGKCKHCSEGEHNASGEHIDGSKAAEMIHKICKSFDILDIIENYNPNI